MTVRASGGVVARRVDDGTIEVLLVHRPRYDDWSFPKGKCHADETDEACALREVEEETGLRCDLGAPLPSTRYLDGKGRDKVVRYWEMAVVGERPWQPDDEVDEQRWLSVDDAASLLTYRHDRAVLDAYRRFAAPA